MLFVFRKPPILPPAKKSLYHVVHVPWMEPSDVESLLWRRHAYNNALTSMRKLWKAETAAHDAARLGIGGLRNREEEELNARMRDNERENARLAEARKSREQRDANNLYDSTLRDIEKSLTKADHLSATKSAEVRAAIERSVHFVTRENLDARLLEALENPRVHEFAIDLQGKELRSATPVKYLSGTPTRQKARLYDRSLVKTRE